MITLRAVCREDAAQIADIYNHYVLETTVSFETQPVDADEIARRMDAWAPLPYFVAEEGGQVLGYAYVHPWKDRPAYVDCYETTVYVRHGHEGRGIGAQLMHRLIGECRARGYRHLIACITATNEGSIEFHRRLGFEQASLFRAVGYKLGQTLDVIDLQLQL